MNEKKILKNIFDNLESSLYSDMSIRIEHDLEDGKYREYLVKKIFGKIIPSKYSITNGFVIDSDNNISKEMDIIIYDRSYVPPFFDETYTVVPIEAVIAVIQVKTTITAKTLKESIDNLNSIDHLNSKTGGKIISATGVGIIEEKRYIAPYKIIVAYKTKYANKHDFSNIMKDIDMLYIAQDGKPLTLKHRPNNAVVNTNKDELKQALKQSTLEVIYNSRLTIFALTLLEKMKLINNSIIINYEEYIKGAK